MLDILVRRKARVVMKMGNDFDFGKVKKIIKI